MMRSIRNTLLAGGIQTKLLLLTLVGIVGMLAVIALGAVQQRSLIETERQSQVRSVVEVAHGVVQHYGERAEAGTLTSEQAQ